jgi:tetratricopeptide (TPR) repeat protein
MGFRVVQSLDEVPERATLVVHVTGRMAQAVDALQSLARDVAQRAPESALFLAELTHDGPPDESFVAAEHVESVREALGARERGCSALVAVRPESACDDPFAFTRLVFRAATAASDASGSRLSEVVDRLKAMPERHTVAQGYAHVRGAVDFEFGSNEGPAYEPLVALADGARDARQWDHAIAGYRAALLVASRRRDRAAVYMRIGSVERARGDFRESKRVYEKARAIMPEDRVCLDALVSLSQELGDWGRYVELAREQVGHLDTPAEKADLHFSIARAVGTELRDLKGAVAELEKARALEPHRDDVLEALRRAYRVLGDWKKLIEITGIFAERGASDTERSARRFAQAKIALENLADKTLAIAYLDAALTEDPTNDEALDVLVEVRTGRGEVVQLGRALEEIAQRLDEIGDGERAKDARRCLEGLPESTPMPLLQSGEQESAPLLEIEPDEDSEEPSLWEEPSFDARASVPVEEAYAAPRSETMPASNAESTGPMAALPPTLEELPPDSLLEFEEPGAFGGAHESPLRAAATLPAPPEPSSPSANAAADQAIDVPIFVAGETGLHAALVNPIDPDALPAPPSAPPASTMTPIAQPATSLPESWVGPQSVDEGALLLELEEAVAKSPLDGDLHARLYDLHVRAGRGDRALLSAIALDELGVARTEHLVTINEGATEGPIRMRALLDAPAWEQLRAPGSDDVVESLFDAIGPAAVAAHVEYRRARRKLHVLDPERKQSATSTVSIVASFQWAARVLGVPCPDLYVLDEVPGDIAAVPTAEPSTAIGPGALSGLSSKEIAFLVARHLTYYRREHAPLVYFSSLPELTVLVLACVQMELPAMPIPPAVASSVASLRGRMTPHVTPSNRTAMAAAVQRLESRGGRLDLAGWARSVELTSARTGLFLSGDLRAATARLRADGAQPPEVLEQVRADLIAFSVSRAHAELRAEFALLAQPRTSGLRDRGEVAIPAATQARAG